MANKCEIDKEFEGVRCRIDKRIVLVWIFPIISLIIGFFLIFILLYSSTEPDIGIFSIGASLQIFSLLLFIVAIFIALTFIWFILRYRSINYIISTNEIVINEGVINKKRTVIPYNQIQNMHIRRPILYRLMGLAYVEVETAGISHGFVEGFIPGVANADEIVKELLVRVEKYRKTSSIVKSYDREILSKILNELKEINKTDNGQIKKQTDFKGPTQSDKEKEEGKSEKSVLEKKNICLPVEKAPPDELGDTELMSDVLRELTDLKKKIEK